MEIKGMESGVGLGDVDFERWAFAFIFGIGRSWAAGTVYSAMWIR